VSAARTGVVVLNHGDSTDTLGCLASLEQSDDLDVEVLVVDNGPEDAGHRRLVEAVGGRARVIATGDNLGYAAGNNIGIQQVLDAGCRYVWLLNPDTVVAPDTLPRLLDHLGSVPDCGIVGPRLVLPGSIPLIWSDGGHLDESAHGATSHLNAGLAAADVLPGKPRDVDYVSGASLLVRRSVVDTVGPLPEDYFLYFEETDWCVQARRHGWRVMVAPAASVVHLKRSSGELPKPYYLYYMTRNRYLFARRCLERDGEAALAELEASFIEPWRERVELRAPYWLPAFDRLVEMAKADARAGRWGRRDDITEYAEPVA